MKNKLLVLITILLLIISLPAKANLLFYNLEKSYTVTEEIDFLFQDLQQIKLLLVFSPLLQFKFSNYSGVPIKIEPTAGFPTIGEAITVTGNGTFTLDYSKAPKDAPSLGILVTPQGGNASFSLLITQLEDDSISTTSSSGGTTTISTTSSSGEIISSNSSSGSLKVKPNGLFIINLDLPENITEKIYTPNENLKCVDRPCGVNPENIDKQSIEDIGYLLSDGLSKAIAVSDPDFDFSLLTANKNKRISRSIYRKKLINDTGETKINLTAIYPAFIRKDSQSLSSKITEVKLRLTTKNKFKKAENGGFYIAQDPLSTVPPECIGPTFITPNASCTTDLSPGPTCTTDVKFSPSICGLKESSIKPKTVQGIISKEGSSSGSIDLPRSLLEEIDTKELVNIQLPKKIYESGGLTKDDSISIFQFGRVLSYTILNITDPANIRSIETVITTLTRPSSIPFTMKVTCRHPVDCNSSCANEGFCCEADKEGFIAKTCKQSSDATIRVCKCLE